MSHDFRKEALFVSFVNVIILRFVCFICYSLFTRPDVPNLGQFLSMSVGSKYNLKW